MVYKFSPKKHFCKEFQNPEKSNLLTSKLKSLNKKLNLKCALLTSIKFFFNPLIDFFHSVDVNIRFCYSSQDILVRIMSLKIYHLCWDVEFTE